MSEWPSVKFGSLLNGNTRNGVYKPKEFHGTGTKIVNMGELFAYPRLGSVPMKRIRLSSDELDRFTLMPGDLLFARRSLVAEGAGKCSIVLALDEPTAFESSIIRARINSEQAYSLYLYYFFNSSIGLYQLETIRRQVAVSGITGSDLVRLEIPLPPLPEQRAIAAILGALDDKIELNRRMSATLEAVARAIFRSWFVDFDPVHAKATGTDIGLPESITSLFPIQFATCELGEIPDGWSVGTILEIADLLSGGTPSTTIEAFWNGPIPWLSAKDVNAAQSRFVLDTEKHISLLGVENSSTKILPKLTTIVTARGTVGKYCILGRDMAMNQTNYGLAAKPFASPFWVFFCLAGMVEQLKQQAYGTIFDTITTATFRNTRIIIPQPSLHAAFDSVVGPLMSRLLSTQEESRSLTGLRGALLPKLISGQLRVSEAASYVTANLDEPLPRP
jgi:type I restriction enzyme S subunit